MDNSQWIELDVYIQSFLLSASTGIFISFVLWCCRQIIKAFIKFF